MATHRSGHRPAGGLHSKNVSHRSAPKVEPRPRAINPSAVAQLGTHVGDKATHVGRSTGYRGEPLVRGSGYSPPQGPTDNVKAVGVGGGRTIYKTGTQCQTGAVNPGEPQSPGRGILTNE
jgi:hypothetical protein